MPRLYKLYRDSLQDRFHRSRAKVQIFGGGFGNGKTTAAVVKAIGLARDYPGSNGLIARATYPKLVDTIQREFLEWLPKRWIKSFTKGPPATLVLMNGTTINFRYISQKNATTSDDSTSNLLSATYDWAIIDQIDDSEITSKDLDDIFGRMRGQTPYDGTDETMPSSGPRWIILTLNPTRGWPYKQLIKPIHDMEKGIHSEALMVDTDTGKSIIELFEGSTYTNADNLPPDFIRGLEIKYHGQQRSRYLLGEWGAYEGLVYSEFSDDIHTLPRAALFDHLQYMRKEHWTVQFAEGYDYGLAVPSAYLCSFTDHLGNVFVIDGFYGAERQIDSMAQEILNIRSRYGVTDRNSTLYADPQIFKRQAASSKVGETIAQMFLNERVLMQRGDNGIIAGITKVQSYLHPQIFHINPVTGNSPAPYLYIAQELTFLLDEINDYFWKKSAQTKEVVDEPQDRNDHAMDALKYMLTKQPDITKIVKRPPVLIKPWERWGVMDKQQMNTRGHRYGNA